MVPMIENMYFAPNVERTAFKIGFSITPDLRLDTVVGDINYAKTYIFECEDSRASEDFCHKFFKEFNVRIYEGDGASEWFDISIFKVALKKVIRHAELLGITNHFKFLEKFSPIDRNPSLPDKPLIEIEESDIPDTETNRLHCTNYANLRYLVKHMARFDWTYIRQGGYELKYGIDDYAAVEELLNHNKYFRDTGHSCGFFRAHYKSKRKHTSHIIIQWTRVNSKTIRRTSELDLRLHCMSEMLDDLHGQMIDRTFCL